MPLKICAILINYLGHADTIACVNALVSQAIERIVVLDNSESPSEAQTLRKAFAQNDLIDLIVNEKNLGFAAGINHALRENLSKPFDAFLIINNDTLPPEGLVQNLAKSAEAEGLDIAFLHPKSTFGVLTEFCEDRNG